MSKTYNISDKQYKYDGIIMAFGEKEEIFSRMEWVTPTIGVPIMMCIRNGIEAVKVLTKYK